MPFRRHETLYSALCVVYVGQCVFTQSLFVGDLQPFACSILRKYCDFSPLNRFIRVPSAPVVCFKSCYHSVMESVWHHQFLKRPSGPAACTGAGAKSWAWRSAGRTRKKRAIDFVSVLRAGNMLNRPLSSGKLLKKVRALLDGASADFPIHRWRLIRSRTSTGAFYEIILELKPGETTTYGAIARRAWRCEPVAGSGLCARQESVSHHRALPPRSGIKRQGGRLFGCGRHGRQAAPSQHRARQNDKRARPFRRTALTGTATRQAGNQFLSVTTSAEKRSSRIGRTSCVVAS